MNSLNSLKIGLHCGIFRNMENVTLGPVRAAAWAGPPTQNVAATRAHTGKQKRVLCHVINALKLVARSTKQCADQALVLGSNGQNHNL